MRMLAPLLCLVLTGGLLPAADLDEVRARGSLRVLAVLDPQRPEFFSTRPGLPPGFDHEILTTFTDAQRIKLEVVPVPTWDGLIPALLAGKGDLIAGRFTVTDSRRKRIHFTAEVFPYRMVVITRRPHRIVSTVEELRQEKVGTMKGTNMAEVIGTLGVPAGNVIDDIPTGGLVDALRSGRVSAVVWGVESAIASREKDDADIQLGMFVGSPSSLAFGLRKSDVALLAALNDYIENFRMSPSWSRLVVKYFGEAAPDILKKARGR